MQQEILVLNQNNYERNIFTTNEKITIKKFNFIVTDVTDACIQISLELMSK